MPTERPPNRGTQPVPDGAPPPCRGGAEPPRDRRPDLGHEGREGRPPADRRRGRQAACRRRGPDRPHRARVGPAPVGLPLGDVDAVRLVGVARQPRREDRPGHLGPGRDRGQRTRSARQLPGPAARLVRRDGHPELPRDQERPVRRGRRTGTQRRAVRRTRRGDPRKRDQPQPVLPRRGHERTSLFRQLPPLTHDVLRAQAPRVEHHRRPHRTDGRVAGSQPDGPARQPLRASDSRGLRWNRWVLGRGCRSARVWHHVRGTLQSGRVGDAGTGCRHVDDPAGRATGLLRRGREGASRVRR